MIVEALRSERKMGEKITYEHAGVLFKVAVGSPFVVIRLHVDIETFLCCFILNIRGAVESKRWGIIIFTRRTCLPLLYLRRRMNESKVEVGEMSCLEILTTLRNLITKHQKKGVKK